MLGSFERPPGRAWQNYESVFLATLCDFEATFFSIQLTLRCAKYIKTRLCSPKSTPVNKTALHRINAEMMPAPSHIETVKELLALINITGERLLREWDAQSVPRAKASPANGAAVLPSLQKHKDVNALVGAGSMLAALLQDPAERLKTIATAFFESRALHYASKENIADVLAAAGPAGLDKGQLAQKLNIDAGKLARIMRLLATIHIFEEIGPDRWRNNHVSSALISNKELRASLFGIGLVFYPLGEELLWHWCDPVKSRSYEPTDAVFCKLHDGKTMFEWLSERDSNNKPRMELELFHLAMIGASRTAMPGVLADYPWHALGNATVVDIGGGIGGVCMALANAFPSLRFILEDRAEVIAQARHIWETQHAQHMNRIEFFEYDFFEKQPVLDADIYFMRFIIHDWSDAKAIAILRNVKPALEKQPRSRLLIAEHFIITAHGSELIAPEWRAPTPLPANFGEPARSGHSLDMAVCANLNSLERTPHEFKALIEAAGLRIVRFWMCRGILSVIEVAA